MTDLIQSVDRARRFWKFTLITGIAALLVLLGLGLTRDPSRVPSALVGREMPAFDLPLLDGEGRLVSAEAAGRPLVLNFWASWCVTCRQEHPELVRLGLAARGSGAFAIAGINYRDTAEHALRFLDREGHFPYLSGLDPSGRLGIDFGVYGMPETFFVDASGMVRGRHAGPLTPEVLAEMLPRIGVTP
ncbi:MAG: thiol:disulfide interchange protein [Alphaproteobacteria bacterium HGW-Alphaproteobacteria-1]|jgi:cytochrome c biogenesis protein CcmG/thiol:disulfide interchange protein DsbE|nr:MAG: thiol:disulfide interchange protein [Alphaproteobacteria bacterium HGW-Alphaproteobacteria-1]